MSQRIHTDVRMHGFTSRSTVEDAISWLADQLARSSTRVEAVPLDEATGRVISEDVISDVAVPGFARAMMDGFAVLAADTQGASPYNRLPLEEIGASLPGRPFAGQVTAGKAVRIMTGAPLPTGADAVLPVEQTERTEQTSGLWAVSAVAVGKHVGRPGEDLSRGSVVLSAGRRLRPQDIGVLSSLGLSEISCWARPRVRVVITGNELLPSGTVPRGHQITDSNGPMLSALVGRDGGLPIRGEIVPDDRDALRAELSSEAEVILVSGGTSVGQEDHAPLLLAEMGELAIHGIAMRPSSPTGLGAIGRRLVFLLPGNPVSCLCAYDLFAGRVIRTLGGRSGELPYRTVTAPLIRKLVSMVGRLDYARVKLVDGQVEPLAISGASVLSSTTRADGFVLIPADSEGYASGTEVTVYCYDSA